MNAYQVLIIVVDTRIIGSVANSLQERRFASIGPPDYKDAKVSIFCSEVIRITVGHHGRCGWVRGLCGNNITVRSCQPHGT